VRVDADGASILLIEPFLELPLVDLPVEKPELVALGDFEPSLFKNPDSV
jgi:hypothetical protein